MDGVVASNPTGVSRLAQMQARFQQKQMQEKEQKLLRLYESQTQRAFKRVGRGSAGSSSSSVSSTSSSLGAGKVRQLFQDRRQHNRSYSNGAKAGGSGSTGWDRSYPLEPLGSTASTTKQHLQASKSTGDLKATRGTSLERSYPNNIRVINQYQAKSQVRRSKSQVRSNNVYQPNVVVDLGGSFRQLDQSHKHLYDDDDDVEYAQSQYHQSYKDGQDNRFFVHRQGREEIYSKNRTYNNDDDNEDIENEDPPFQQLDDDDLDNANDFNDSSHVFQKLPNVGGRLLTEKKAYDNNNVDRYKTYNATTNGIRNYRENLDDEEDNRIMTPTAASIRGRQGVAPAANKTTSRKPESKISTFTSTKGPAPKNTSPSKPNSASSWERKTSKRTSLEDTENQMLQRGVPTAQGSAQRGPSSPPHTQSARGPPPQKQAYARGQQQQQPARASLQQLSASARTPPQPSPTASARGPPPAAGRGPAARGPPPANGDFENCKICGRHFAKDRIQVHEKICAKTTQKKRKVFDPTKQRVKGTEAEPYLRKKKPQSVTTVPAARTTSSVPHSNSTNEKHIKKTNWRQKHEDFINAIRAAKEMKAHLAKGGKLSDLPPPPPSDYSDYIQCPHCGRKFNKQAAERHIPKCASYDFNKPKSQAGAGRGGAGGAVKKR